MCASTLEATEDRPRLGFQIRIFHTEGLCVKSLFEIRCEHVDYLIQIRRSLDFGIRSINPRAHMSISRVTTSRSDFASLLSCVDRLPLDSVLDFDWYQLLPGCVAAHPPRYVDMSIHSIIDIGVAVAPFLPSSFRTTTYGVHGIQQLLVGLFQLSTTSAGNQAFRSGSTQSTIHSNKYMPQNLHS